MGTRPSKCFLHGRKVHIPFITDVERLSFPGYTAEERTAVKAWLKEFIISDVNEGIKSITIDLRSRFKLKQTDAFVAATAANWSIHPHHAGQALPKAERGGGVEGGVRDSLE